MCNDQELFTENITFQCIIFVYKMGNGASVHGGDLTLLLLKVKKY